MTTAPLQNKPAPATLLLVDDQAENLMILTHLLEQDYRVRAVRSGEQALRAATSEPVPDLILLDVMMPEMDGYGVLARLQENAQTRHIPVIFVTALDAPEDEERGLALGAVDYLNKPIKPAIVRARIRNHLALKEARDRLSDQNLALESQVAARTQALKAALVQAEAAQDKLRHAYFGSLKMIGELAALRGGTLGDHSRRVGELARRVAVAMQLTAEEIQDVFVAGLLHDIGKIGFPDTLLTKAVSSLSNDELMSYHRHPAIAADALMKVESLARVAHIVRSHHEHYDGSGFPERRSGLDIPLGARILAAVSDHDDLRHGMLSAQPKSAKQACQFLLDNSGRRYDPQVLAALEPLLVAEANFAIDEVLVLPQHLREGMVLTRDVLHPDGFLLLSRNTVLTAALITQVLSLTRQIGSRLEVYVAR